MHHHHPSEQRERMHRLSVVYAMVGLFFGCLSAALIIVSIKPISRTVVVFAPMEQVGPAASTVLMDETSGFRGHRRLTDEMANDETATIKFGRYLKRTKTPTAPLHPTTIPTSSPSPTTLAPTNQVVDTTTAPQSPTTTSPTSSTTLAPTNQVTDDNNEPTIPVSSSGGNSSTTSSMVTTETVAAAMVGVASSIIACALFMYASDLRDWYCHGNNNKWSKESQRHHHDDVLVDVDGNSSWSQSPSAKRFPLEEAESKTSAGSTHEESDYWVQVTSHELVEYQPQNILPPLNEERDENYNNNLALTFLPDNDEGDDDDEDDASISRVSSMTAASYLEGGFSFVDLEEKLSGHDAAKVSSAFSGNVTVLSDAHRVSEYTPLSSLIKGDGGDDGFKGANVKFHQTQDTTTTMPPPPLASRDDCSPDTIFVQDDRVKSNDNTGEEVSGDTIMDERVELTLLEQLIDDVPSDERSIGTPTTHAADAHESVQDDGVKSNYDTDDVSGDKIMDERDELTQLEQLIASIPFDEMSIGTQTDADTHEESEERISRDVFVREVCFVPCAADEGKVSLGLEFYNATDDYHPTVQKVDLSGPLVGRVFIGDAILAVNDKDTVGLAPEEILELFESRDSLSEQHATKMIKLTVMSSVADGGSLSDGQQSVDFDSAIEI